MQMGPIVFGPLRQCRLSCCKLKILMSNNVWSCSAEAKKDKKSYLDDMMI